MTTTALNSEMLVKAELFSKRFSKKYKSQPLLNREAEDFKQFCLESMVRRGNSMLNYEFIVIDFFRSAQSSAPNRRVRAVESPRNFKEKIGSGAEYQAALAPDPNSRFSQVLRYLENGKLADDDRVIAFLIIKYGLDLTEIGECFGVSVSYISQRVKIILKQFL